MKHMQCPACGYYAFNGIECFDCGYRPGGQSPVKALVIGASLLLLVGCESTMERLAGECQELCATNYGTRMLRVASEGFMSGYSCLCEESESLRGKEENPCP